MSDQGDSPTPAKHQQSTAPKSEQDALLDALQAIDPSKVLELVWGLEPQTCSLRVRLPADFLALVMHNIVVIRSELCKTEGIGGDIKNTQDFNNTKHPESTGGADDD